MIFSPDPHGRQEAFAKKARSVCESARSKSSVDRDVLTEHVGNEFFHRVHARSQSHEVFRGKDCSLAESRAADALVSQADGLVGQTEDNLVPSHDPSHTDGVHAPCLVQAQNVCQLARRAGDSLLFAKVFLHNLDIRVRGNALQDLRGDDEKIDAKSDVRRINNGCFLAEPEQGFQIFGLVFRDRRDNRDPAFRRIGIGMNTAGMGKIDDGVNRMGAEEIPGSSGAQKISPRSSSRPTRRLANL